MRPSSLPVCKRLREEEGGGGEGRGEEGGETETGRSRSQGAWAIEHVPSLPQELRKQSLEVKMSFDNQTHSTHTMFTLCHSLLQDGHPRCHDHILANRKS